LSVINLLIRGFLHASRRKSSFFFAMLALVWTVACDPPAPPSLASVNEVGPSILEPGDILKIKGEGFVEGPAEVTLSGSFDPRGMIEAFENVVYLSGAAIDNETVEVSVTEVVMAQLASEPLIFTGTAKVVFPKTNSLGNMQIEATSGNVSLELRPGGGGVEVGAKRKREAEQLLKQLGIELFGNDLIIAAITRNSAAEQSGLSPGDRLLAVDGTALAASSDLAGLNINKLHGFDLVSSSGDVRTVDIQLISADPLAVDEFAAVLLTAIALGLFMAFAAPKKNDRTRNHLSSRSFNISTMFAISASALFLIAFPAMAIISRADVDATFAMLGLLAVFLTIAALYGKGSAGVKIFNAIIHLIPVPIIVVSAGMLNSAFGLWNMVTAQEASLWGWSVWSNPFSLVAFIVTVSLLWPARFTDKEQTIVVRIAAVSAAGIGAIMLVTFLLGGWSLPSIRSVTMEGSPLLLLAGAFVFAIKASLVIAAARISAVIPKGDRRFRRNVTWRILVRTAVLISSTALAHAWAGGELPIEVRSAGQILSAGVFASLSTAFLTSKIRNLISQYSNGNTPPKYSAEA